MPCHLFHVLVILALCVLRSILVLRAQWSLVAGSLDALLASCRAHWRRLRHHTTVWMVRPNNTQLITATNGLGGLNA